MKIASTFLSLLAASPRVPCAEDTGKFFGDSLDDDEPYDDEHRFEATVICHEKCPIRLECLAQALYTNETHGVWGGMTPSQREQLKGRL